jgi:hypothetical protein
MKLEIPGLKIDFGNGFAPILKAVHELWTRDKRQLADLLRAIVGSLEEIRRHFEKRKVPRREAHKLAEFINAANQIAASKKIDPDLAIIFRERVPALGRLLRSADFFIDGRPRDPDHYVAARPYDLKVPKGGPIAATCETLERIIGALEAHIALIEQSIGRQRIDRKTSASKSRSTTTARSARKRTRRSGLRTAAAGKQSSSAVTSKSL